ncbi:amidohydrolase family protein [Pseudonocardia sp.]|uniref:amidohydrolase family protein n=1 Tax=Pseudonocardia sp. TaxID=60912 RepID=UPI003D0C5787
MATTVLRGGTILTGEAGRPPIEAGWLLVEDGLIAAVGEGDPPGADEVIDASGMLVIPGFVNAHTHLCMIYGRSLGTDRDLLHWLGEAQIPVMRGLEPSDYALSMTLGAVENLKAGNTTVCEVFFSPHYDAEVDQVAAQALDDSGIRSVLFRCTNDESFFDGFVEDRGDIVRRVSELHDRWPNDGRTRIGGGPLIPWGSSEGSFRDLVELSADRGMPLHLHTAETPEYNDLVRERTGRSNVEMLADVGSLGPAVMLNHCVHLSERDIALIAEAGSPVIHDPTSNMLLASGVAPVPALRAAGVPLGLGCDGPACNNGQDMIENMKYAALLQKAVSRRADVVVAEEVFRMATHGGATAIGLGDRLGMLAPGFLADVVLVDARGPHMTPLHDPLAALVYSARGSDVDTVLVGGSVVVRGGVAQTVDEQQVVRDVARRAAAVRAAC